MRSTPFVGAAAIALCLAACGGDESSDTSSSAPTGSIAVVNNVAESATCNYAVRVLLDAADPHDVPPGGGGYMWRSASVGPHTLLFTEAGRTNNCGAKLSPDRCDVIVHEGTTAVVTIGYYPGVLGWSKPTCN